MRLVERLGPIDREPGQTACAKRSITGTRLRSSSTSSRRRPALASSRTRSGARSWSCAGAAHRRTSPPSGPSSGSDPGATPRWPADEVAEWLGANACAGSSIREVGGRDRHRRHHRESARGSSERHRSRSARPVDSSSSRSRSRRGRTPSRDRSGRTPLRHGSELELDLRQDTAHAVHDQTRDVRIVIDDEDARRPRVPRAPAIAAATFRRDCHQDPLVLVIIVRSSELPCWATHSAVFRIETRQRTSQEISISRRRIVAGGDRAVADAPHGLDPHGSWSDLCAQVAHVRVDGARSDDRACPDRRRSGRRERARGPVARSGLSASGTRSSSGREHALPPCRGTTHACSRDAAGARRARAPLGSGTARARAAERSRARSSRGSNGFRTKSSAPSAKAVMGIARVFTRGEEDHGERLADRSTRSAWSENPSPSGRPRSINARSTSAPSVTNRRASSSDDADRSS